MTLSSPFLFVNRQLLPNVSLGWNCISNAPSVVCTMRRLARKLGSLLPPPPSTSSHRGSFLPSFRMLCQLLNAVYGCLCGDSSGSAVIESLDCCSMCERSMASSEAANQFAPGVYLRVAWWEPPILNECALFLLFLLWKKEKEAWEKSKSCLPLMTINKCYSE